MIMTRGVGLVAGEERSKLSLRNDDAMRAAPGAFIAFHRLNAQSAGQLGEPIGA